MFFLKLIVFPIGTNPPDSSTQYSALAYRRAEYLVISTGTFYSWKKKYDTQGEVGLKMTYDTRSKELKQAEEENRILRKLLSNKEIELEVQRELLKKKFGTSDPRKI